jgi:peptidoglycan/LPS O-acetylase OafA/YrhL
MGFLRLLLALAVVVWHSQPLFGLTLIGGPNAVDVFFVISGFYMALILAEKYSKSSHSYKTFISNRLLKIYPTYWICFLISIIIGAVGFFLVKNTAIFEPFILYFGKMSIFTILYLVFANLFILGQDMMLFLGFSSSSQSLYFTKNFLHSDPQVLSFFPVDQAWSISLELIFYLMAPFLVKLKSRYLIAIIVLSLAGRIIVYHLGLDYDPWNYRFFPLEIIFFLIGILGYRWYKQIEKWPRSTRYGWLALLAVITFSISYQFVFPTSGNEVKRWVYYSLVMPLIPFVFVAFKNIRFDRAIGELSFPLYLSHNIFIYIIMQLLNYKGTFSSILVVASSLLFSYLLIKVVINPLDQIRQARVAGKYSDT